MATKFGPGLAKATKHAIYTVKSWVHWSGVIIGGLSFGVGYYKKRITQTFYSVKCVDDFIFLWYRAGNGDKT